MTEQLRIRAPEAESRHPSPWALERHHAGEGDAARRAELDAHLETCDACRDLLEGLERSRREFLDRPGGGAFLARLEREAGARREPAATALWRPWLLGAGAAAALALVLVLAWVAGPAPQADGALDGVRVKGAENRALDFYLQRDGHPVLADPAVPLHPGDRIQFALTGPRGGYVHLVSVDEAGKFSVYYPRSGSASEVFPGGMQRPVPGSIALDDTLGRERVFALICEESMSVEQLKGRLSRHQDEARRLLDSERLDLGVACRQLSITLRKERRP